MVVHEGLTLNINLPKAKTVTVVDFIGAGAYGSVWKVKDISTGSFFALKHIRLKQQNPGDIAKYAMKMSKESEINLPTPYIVKAFGLSKLDNNGLDYAILFELVEGIDLDEWIINNKHTSINVKLELFYKILEGVTVAHNHNIYHRDLKPQNIKIASGNIPKILDFGLASVKDKNITESKEISGTISYIAPESMVNIKTNEEYDIYSLGCILYEILRNQNYLKFLGMDMPPFGKMMSSGKLTQGNILDFDSRFQSDLSCSNLVTKALKNSTCFNPQFRYKSAANFLSDIKTGSVSIPKDFSEKVEFFIKENTNRDIEYDWKLFRYYPEVIAYIIGLLFAIFSNGFWIFFSIVGFIFAGIRGFRLYSFYDNDRYSDITDIFKYKLGYGIILIGSFFLLISMFIGKFFVFLAILITVLGVYSKNSKMEWE